MTDEYLNQLPHTLGQLYFYVWVLMALYALTVSVFMVLENRSPQLTFAWLFLFYLFPIVGVIIYFMFGRNYRAFSRKDKLLRQKLDSIVDSNEHMAQLAAQQGAALAQLKQAGPSIYGRVAEVIRCSIAAPLFPYNCVEIFRNGRGKYTRLIEDLKAAQHSIHMEYYEWSSDAYMQGIKQILLAKAQEGVEVRLLYDPIGSFLMLKWGYIREMNAGGVKMIPYSPLYYIHTLSYRNHRKIVVIDGCIGYIGGMNMAYTYLTKPEKGDFTGWRDTHARLTGQAVWGLQASFIIQWYNTTQEHLVDPAYFPPLEETPGYLPIQVINSGPDSQWQVIRQLYFALITAAQHHIYIQSPFFILDESLAEALSGAARAGVDVKVMLAPDGPDGGFAYRAGYTYAQNMAEAGVSIYYYQNDYFHTKTIAVDSVICSLGSANMDIRSFAINYESNLLIYDERTTRAVEQDFIEDLKQCQAFNVRAYKRGPLLGRVRDSLFRLASPLL